MPTQTLPLLTADPVACCPPLTGRVVDEDQAEQLARILKALADPHRIRLLSLIAAHDGSEACICELTDPIGLSQPTVSHHMKQLTDAGLVTREQRGKWAYYRIIDDTLNSLAAALTPAARTQGPRGWSRSERGHPGRRSLATSRPAQARDD
jgi:ArsR family transcriptional regulator, arsenate/arsenite/antimonite-responsive transcriptional repressor